MVTPMKVHGVDHSHHNPTPDLKQARKAGLQFYYHKAVEGATLVDERYEERRQLAYASGVRFGAYHFARPDADQRDAVKEARWFMEHATPKAGDLMPVLDLEVPGSLEQWSKDFMAEVHRILKKNGLKPKSMHYGPNDFGDDYPFLRWVPRYNNDNRRPEVPWDIWQFSNGDLGVPNQFPGVGHCDLNTLRDGLSVDRLVLMPAKPAKQRRKVRHGHISLQFSDSPDQHQEDVDRIFAYAVKRKWAWFGGTEAGPGAKDIDDKLRKAAEENGYRFFIPKASRLDCWVAVREDLIVKGSFEGDFIVAVPGDQNPPDHDPHGPKGPVWVTFDTPDMGTITVAVAHYLTDAHHPGAPRWEKNKKVAEVIGELAINKGKGRALFFYNGDQNMADQKNKDPQGDTFFGAPLTSYGDALEKWESTGHGPIDVFASFDGDGRSTPVDLEVLTDKEYFLNTDHWMIEATTEIVLL